MNDFEKALEEIKKEYPVRRMGDNYAQIEFDILFDAYNCIFIGVLFENNQVILTDMADYAQLFSFINEEEDVIDIAKICQRHGITFRNYHIECIYHNNDDVKHYLDCLLELSDAYANY